jgi:hypothetical protein
MYCILLEKQGLWSLGMPVTLGTSFCFFDILLSHLLKKQTTEYVMCPIMSEVVIIPNNTN